MSPPPVPFSVMDTASVAEIRHRLGRGGTFFAGAGAVGALVGLVLLALLVADLAPADQLTFVVGLLVGMAVALLVGANLWLMATLRRQ
jgi:hypothetical protein